ncbi:hypothetical protein C0J52_02366 [Blattella germanica]|nr:hypothetical protein C0J52_02366 [Blattella germanica]
MGCISSKADINDLHPNIFQVMNVDEQGNRLSPGQLEITETDLVLYQRKKPPVKWPLRCLRRYGFDAELFSFESGRRCPTGPGIYAFRCQRAEQLFNMVQTNIQVRNSAEDAVSREFPVASMPVPAVASRVGISADTNYLEPSNLRSGIRVNAPSSIRFPSQNGGGPTRLGSVGSSNGPLSPQGTTSPSPPPAVIPTTIPAPLPNNNNPAVYYANEDLFSSVAAATTTPTVTTISSPTESSDTVQQQQQRIFRQPYLNTETVPGTVAPPPPTEQANKTVCRLSVGSGDGITNVNLDITTPNTQTHSTPSYINVDLSADSGTGLLSPSYSLDEESNYARLELSNDAQQCHVYMNIIPGPENGVTSAPDKPSTTIRPKPVLPSFGKQQQDWESEERHCYANLEPGEIEVARSHIPKRLSGIERVPPLPLYSSAIQSQTNPMTPPPGIPRTVNYIVLDLDQTKTDSTTSNTNASQQPTSPVGSVPPSSLSLPPESPKRAAEGYATIDFNKTVALSHSVNPNVDNDSEGSRKTRHNSTINDLVSPSTRLSSSE